MRKGESRVVAQKASIKILKSRVIYVLMSRPELKPRTDSRKLGSQKDSRRIENGWQNVVKSIAE